MEGDDSFSLGDGANTTAAVASWLRPDMEWQPALFTPCYVASSQAAAWLPARLCRVPACHRHPPPSHNAQSVPHSLAERLRQCYVIIFP